MGEEKRFNASLSAVTGQQDPCWEVVIEKKDFRVWKRPIPNSHLYEYRGQPTHIPHTCSLGFCDADNAHIQFFLFGVLSFS